MQEELIEILKSSIEDPDSVTTYDTEEMDADMTNSDFEAMAIADAEKIKKGKMVSNEAEEESEANWDEI